jgi:hypothetical protein
VTLVRVIWLAAALFWIGVPAYVVAWIAIPSDDGTATVADRPRDVGVLVALALIAIGALIAADTWLPTFWHGGRLVAPLLLVAGGATILWLRRPVEPNESESETAAGAGGPVEARIDVSPADALPAPEPEPAAPTEPASAWTQTAPWPTAREIRRTARAERRAQRPRSFLTPVTLSGLLIGGGVMALLQSNDVIDVNLTVALAVATCVVGAVLIFSAWIGRAHGLIALGVLLVAATTVASVIDVPLRGGFGDEQHAPLTTAEVQPSYELAAGRLYLNFRRVPFTGSTNVRASVGFGRLQVDVASNVNIVVDAHVGAGSINLFGQHHDGFHRDASQTVRSDGGGTALLHLTLRTGAGEIDVHRFDARGFETLITEKP